MGTHIWQDSSEAESHAIQPRQSDFETRVQRAREANLALYLDDPTPDSARLLELFEEVVRSLRAQRKAEQR